MVHEDGGWRELWPGAQGRTGRLEKEGRITAECQLLIEGTGQWQWAADVYPDLDEPAEQPAPTPSLKSTAGKKAAAKLAPEPEPEPEVPSFGAAVEEDEEEDDDDEAVPVAKKLKAKRSKKAALRDDEEDEDDEPHSSRSKAIAGLLGIFLGPVGAHRFYLGYWGLGIAMLFTAGGCGIWSLVDGIFVLLGKIPDADGRPLAD